jgi:hypothetical protein
MGGRFAGRLDFQAYRDAVATSRARLTASSCADSINLHPGEEIFSNKTSQRQAGGSR